MRRITERIVIVSILALLLFASACALKSVRKESEATPSGSETIAATTTPTPTARPTVTPTPTKKPTPTPKPTATPKPTPTATPTPEPDPLDDYSLQEGFLIKDVSAEDAEGKVKLLKAGSLICIFSREEGIIDESSRFFLTDYYSASSTDSPDDEVFFEISRNRLGAICFSGIPEHELFGNGETVELGKRKVVEVEPGTQVKWISETERYVMRIDWDRDGYEDEVAFEIIDERYSAEVICYFKSGKDGSTIRVRIKPDLEQEFDDYAVSAETLLLTQKPNGAYVVLICDDLHSFMPWVMSMQSWAVSYGTEQVFAKKDISGLFEYQDGVLYQGDDGRFFAWYTKTKTAVQLNDDLSCKYLSGTHYFLNYRDPITYLLQDMQVQMKKDTRYVPETLPVGTFIIPERIEVNSSGEGFFYFRLIDGRCARLRMETDEEYEIFDGKPFSEVFYFMVCG